MRKLSDEELDALAQMIVRRVLEGMVAQYVTTFKGLVLAGMSTVDAEDVVIRIIRGESRVGGEAEAPVEDGRAE